MSRRTDPYPSDLTDEEWAILEPLLPDEPDKARGGRPIEYCRREIINAILYTLKEGCSWRALPRDFPHYALVYHYFASWKRSGDWERMHNELVEKCRRRMGKSSSPTAAIIDSQSVKTADHAGERGYDAGKKIKGRKRHILVDTLGLILAVVVHTANIQDRDGAKLVFDELDNNAPNLELVWADSGYSSQELFEYVADLRDEEEGEIEIELEIVKRSDDVRGFEVLPHRWIVERTFAWLSKLRRLAKDFETLIDSSTAMIHLGMIRHMIKRLAA